MTDIPQWANAYFEWREQFTGWPDAPAVRMAAPPTRAKFVDVPQADIEDAMKHVVERHIGVPLPADTKVTRHWQQAGKVWHIEVDSQEFPENEPGVIAQELPRRKR